MGDEQRRICACVLGDGIKSGEGLDVVVRHVITIKYGA
jgi:hypothetical protein